MIAALALSAAAQVPAGEPPQQPWTLLIYGAADNDADGHMFHWLADVREAIGDDPGWQVILFMDRHAGHSKDADSLGEDFTGARLYRIRRHTAERLHGGAELPQARLDREWEADSADPDTLGRFLRYGKAHFPARHTALVIYGHANGITMCPDQQSRRAMGIAQLTQAVSAAAAVDVMALELCNMGGVEIAYQWRPGNGGFSADYLVAIPNAGPPLDWRRIFSRLHPAAEITPLDFALRAVEAGEEGRRAAAAEHPDEGSEEAAAAYDLRTAAAVKAAVDAFAAALGRVPAAREPMESLRDQCLDYVGGDLRSETAYVDLYDLLQRAAGAEALPGEARAAAGAALEAVDALVIASFGMSGYPGFQPGRNGLFVSFPDGDARVRSGLLSKAPVWKQYRWYGPAALEDRGEVAGSWAWSRDGATPGNGVVENWFELLDSWFDGAEDGGVNGYAP